MAMQNSIVKTRVSQGDVDGGAEFDYSRILRVVGQELEAQGDIHLAVYGWKRTVSMSSACATAAAVSLRRGSGSASSRRT